MPGAGLRPPLKLDVQFSRIQLSGRRPILGGYGRDKTNKVHKSELTVKPGRRQCLPPHAAPALESVRPDSPHDPSVELVEELSDVGALEVVPPSAQHGVDLLDQFFGSDRCLSPGKTANLVFEVLDRLFSWKRIQRPRRDSTSDLRGRQIHCPSSPLDLETEKIEAVLDVHDPRLLRMDAHAKRFKNSSRGCQRRTGLFC